MTAFGAISITELLDRVKRNAEIVALVKARMMPMRKIAARYRLSVSTISSIAIKHGVWAYVTTPDPEKLRVARDLINRGMPLTHVAQTMGFNIQTLRGILEDEGLYVRSLPTLWTEAEVRVLRSDPPAGVIAAARADRVLAMKSTTGDGFDVTAQIQFTTTPCTSAGVASG